MLKDRLIFLFSFAILGVVGAFLFRHSDSIKPPEETKTEAVEPAKPPAPLVLTARRALSSGERLNQTSFSWDAIEQKDMDPSLIYWSNENEKWMNDATVMNDVSKGDKIRRLDVSWSNESYPQENKYKAIPLSNGKRAIPFRMSLRSPMIQYMIPGKFVDLAYTSKADLGFGFISLTLLNNIRILDVAYPPQRKTPNQRDINDDSAYAEILLEVTQKQAEIYFFAEDTGKVSLTLSDPYKQNHRESSIENLVNNDSIGDFRSVIITHMTRSLFNNVPINIKATPQGYIISGKVPDPQMAGKIIEVLQKLAPGGEKNIVNLMEVEPQQVLLRVKVMEVSKQVLANLGINWDVIYSKCGQILAGGGLYPLPGIGDPTYFLRAENIPLGPDTSLNALVNLIQEDGNARILAEPNLTTISGTTAHFFAGGEFPILVPQGGNLIGTVTIEYKNYGVILDFTPFIDLNGLITLHVVPEISALDYNNGVVLTGFQIPGLLVRRADTVVKLWSGQSYIIAGLLQYDWDKIDSHLYCLDRLPIIGPLFCSKKFKSHQTELVIIVTPFLLSSERVHAHDQCQNIPCQETPWMDPCEDNVSTFPIIAEELSPEDACFIEVPAEPKPCSKQSKKRYQPAFLRPRNRVLPR